MQNAHVEIFQLGQGFQHVAGDEMEAAPPGGKLQSTLCPRHEIDQSGKAAQGVEIAQLAYSIAEMSC